MERAPSSPAVGRALSPASPGPAGHEADHTALKTRRGLVVLAMTAVGTLPTDVAIVSYIEPAPWQVIVGIRVVTFAVMLALVAVLRVTQLDGRRLLYVERFTTPLLTILFAAAPAAVAGGLSSVYGTIPIMALVFRSAIRADPWKQALPSVVATVLAYPLMLAVTGAFSPRVAAQWAEPTAVATLAAYTLGAATVGVFTLWAGQTTRSLQNQLYEARKIGRYKLITLLGRGGMGEVWAAHFPALKREVAIKVLRLPDDMAVARFEREVRATAELSHPNTVRVFDYGRTDDGLWYYAMEKLEGESLAALIRREAPIPPARAIHFLLQAARALAEAHGRGIIHRDIKPENLFVADQGGERDFIKVLDFGIAKTAPEGSVANLETTGTIQGTPGYIAPEILRGRPLDGRVDIYSLGATGYAMLTGAPPFRGQTIAAIIESTLRGNPEPLSAQVDRPIPGDIEALILRCLDPDPEARYGSASELAAALSRCADAGSHVPDTGPEHPSTRCAVGEADTIADAGTVYGDAPKPRT